MSLKATDYGASIEPYQKAMENSGVLKPGKDKKL